MLSGDAPDYRYGNNRPGLVSKRQDTSVKACAALAVLIIINAGDALPALTWRARTGEHFTALARGSLQSRRRGI